MKNNNRYNLSFIKSNKYIYAKIIANDSGICLLSLSTSSFLFQNLRNKNNTIATKLLSLLCRKLLFNNGIKIINFYKINSNYSGKLAAFIRILTNKIKVI